MKIIRKTVLSAFLLIASALVPLAAETIYLPSLVPLDPTVIGQGGSYTAVARGYQSFFTNPAGYRMKNGSLTLLSATTWLRARPDILLDDVMNADFDDPMAIISMLQHQYEGGVDAKGTEYPGNGMVGVGASSGIGWAGGGIGLGLISTFEATTYGRSFPFGLKGELYGGFDFIGGIALPINILGVDFSIGGDVRPIVRMYAPLTPAVLGDVLLALGQEGSDPLDKLTGVPTLNGFGLAIDTGAIASLGPFNLAVSARDLFGTRLSFAEHSLSQVTKSLQLGELPAEDLGNVVTDEYRIPMSLSLGASFHPNLGPFRHLIDPTVHAEIKDVLALARQEHLTVWTRLHLGTELRILHFLKVRAGINQGYFTVGAGAKLLFLDVNAALFTQELGRFAGERPSAGVSVEAAIRF
jgi:hypothetical protein